MAKRNPSKASSTPQPAAARATTSEATARADSRRAQRVLQQRRAERRKRLLTLGGVGGAALLVVLAFIIYSSRSDSASASNKPISVPTLYGDGVPMDGATLGDPNATVVLQEWGDYQCPGCGQFARTSEQQIIDQYVTTGKIRFEFHDFPFLDQPVNGHESHKAAEAAHCAGDQGKFWDYHRTLYYNQADKENSGGFADKRLIAAATALNLDVDQFTTCLKDGTHADEVTASYDQGTSLSINQTPSFFVNGTLINGANFSQIKQALDAAIAGQ